MKKNDSARVVITGMGTVNPLGASTGEFYENLVNGRSGVKLWSSLDMTGVQCRVGGDLGDFDASTAVAALQGRIPEQKFIKLKKTFRNCSFANKLSLIASLEAYMDAGFLQMDLDPAGSGLVVAGHDINHGYILKNNIRFLNKRSSIDVLSGFEGLDTGICAVLAEFLAVRGSVQTAGGACASGNLALKTAVRDILSGEVERSFVVAPPFDITNSDIYAMTILGAVIVDQELQETPGRCSRPFDTRRAGFVPSHGAGALVLESLEAAKERGARIYGEILGVRSNCDGSRLPSPSSENQAILMQQLLKDAGMQPEDVDYVNCHATSTKIGDIEEINAVKMAFGSHAGRLRLNATKSMIGHTTWSAAVVETIAGLLQMQNGMLHPSINIDELDPEIDLDVCPNSPVKHDIRCMLKNSFGFGGINCCSLIRRFED